MDRAQRNDIMRRERTLRDYLGARCSYMPEEVAHLNPPTNEERSAVEVFDWLNDPPEKYFLYIREAYSKATTWTGEVLGTVSFGAAYRDNFGGERVPITIRGTNGRMYHGTYFKSAGDYARVRMAKHQRA